jgi:hypothetical protein
MKIQNEFGVRRNRKEEVLVLNIKSYSFGVKVVPCRLSMIISSRYKHLYVIHIIISFVVILCLCFVGILGMDGKCWFVHFHGET